MSKKNNKAMLLSGASILTLMCFSNVEAAFINEIHYDNDGLDVNEAVEIFAEVSTDFSGWSLVLYNGSDGLSYRTIDLSRFDVSTGAIAVDTPRIQNGMDGIALVDNASVVWQFLSYEGTFKANDGPASGFFSQDIGVAESADLPGLSLQLQGTGSNYNDFTWSGQLTSTFGSINTGQTLAPVPAPAAVWLFGSGLLGLIGISRKKKS